jgi:uncharacterized protein YwgA
MVMQNEADKEYDVEEKRGLLYAFKRVVEDALGRPLDLEKEDFSDRLIFQKSVLIAKRFGLDLGYKYDFYLRGPYSTQLAKDYFNMKPDGSDSSRNLPASFREEEFKALIKGKNIDWFELAATIIGVWEFNPRIDEEHLLDHVKMLKGTRFQGEKIEQVYRDLKDRRVF